MSRALIGHTGFVGSNLAAMVEFDHFYNSKNIDEMKGLYFDEIVCAGLSSTKWQVNKDPETDWKNILSLQNVLSTVSTSRFILISTIDVYPLTQFQDESFDCSEFGNHPYGMHRLAFEKFCKDHFPNWHIFRLPAIFGKGIKKNIIFDLLNNHRLEMINPESSFQYYSLNNLWLDVSKAVQLGLKLMNFFTEPIVTKNIIRRFFCGKQVGQSPEPICHYNLHTRHAALWGKPGPYLYTKNEVLAQLGNFVKLYHHEKGL